MVVPLDPLVDDPLVALHQGAAQVLHPLVWLALNMAHCHYQLSTQLREVTCVLMVCQKSAVPSWGGTTRPRAGNTVAPPALTVDRYTMKVSSLSPLPQTCERCWMVLCNVIQCGDLKSVINFHVVNTLRACNIFQIAALHLYKNPNNIPISTITSLA